MVSTVFVESADCESSLVFYVVFPPPHDAIASARARRIVSVNAFIVFGILFSMRKISEIFLKKVAKKFARHKKCTYICSVESCLHDSANPVLAAWE